MKRRFGRKSGPAAAVALALALAAHFLAPESSRDSRHPPSAPGAATGRTARDQSVAGEILTGKVVKVSDGDTITVLDSRKVQHKVRLLGIDAPEKSQPFGNACRERLAELVAGREVTVVSAGPDRYGRMIGKVLVGEKDANLAQVESGCAWHYRQFSRNQTPADRESYARAEEKAREEKRGLWQDRAPQAPWDYRRARRAQSYADGS